jgi:hypothetical protein
MKSNAWEFWCFFVEILLRFSMTDNGDSGRDWPESYDGFDPKDWYETPDEAWDDLNEADYYNGTGDNDDNSGSDYYDRD